MQMAVHGAEVKQLECNVMPPALMAATPVGAVTTIRLELSSLIWRRNVVLPVPALPVRKIFLHVWRTYSNASSNWGLETKLILLKFATYDLGPAALFGDRHTR